MALILPECERLAPAPGDLFDVAPALGPLLDNGGPTRTHRPQTGSPAIDAGNPAGCTDADGTLLSTDQRGITRPQGSTCDVGAVELAHGYFTLTPCRLADTRDPSSGPPLSANTPRVIPVAGICGVPFSATAVGVNLTVAGPGAPGHCRLYPDGGPIPFSSAINFATGAVRSNNAVVPIGSGGGVVVHCPMTSSSAWLHFVLDVFGYFE